MPHTSHLEPMFHDFIAASSRLEEAYHQLQQEVTELRVENERMRLDVQQILDSMPCGVLVLDRQANITMINPESGRLLGPLENAKTTLRPMAACSGIQEFRIDGRWLEVRNRPLLQGDRTILILRDITAQKRAEEERGAAREALALAEITTILAHEIRNPLASLELFAELIENDGELREQWISNLRVGIRTLSGTVNNVLSFHGSGSLKLVPVSLSAVIGNAVQFVKPLAQQASVTLDWRVDHFDRWVLGNESALQQVALNLLSNAIRHTPACGSVAVSLETEQNRALLEFCDSGCGIRPDQMGRIFEPGFSGSGDRSGLGLAVCSRIVKQHGGHICVSNQMERGARFAVSLPLLQMEAGAA